MAIIGVTEDWRALAIDAAADLDGATGSMVRRFQVKFDAADTPSERAILALTASYGGTAVPAYWAAHPSDGDYFVKRKSVAPVGPFDWDVTCVYEYIENPLLQPYSVQFIPQGTMEAIDKAVDDAELCNSSKEPFDPPIQEEFYDFAITIQRNEAAFNIATANPYLNAVNGDVFSFYGRNSQLYSFAAGQVRCKSIQATEQRHGPAWYWQVQYEFVVRNDGWLRRILDQGFRRLESNEYVQIADADGNPLTQPAKLDGSGGVLAPNGTPVYLEFQTKKAMAFSAFNFV